MRNDFSNRRDCPKTPQDAIGLLEILLNFLWGMLWENGTQYHKRKKGLRKPNAKKKWKTCTLKTIKHCWEKLKI